MRSFSDFIKNKKILLFDIDDTLVETSAKIFVRTCDGVKKVLTNNEYNTYKLSSGEFFDYTEFDDYERLMKDNLTKYFNTLKREYSKGTSIAIITARGSIKGVEKFLRKYGISLDRNLIFAISDPSLKLKGTIKERKANVIKRLHKTGYNTFVFFDDNEDNLYAAKNLENNYNIKIITIHV